MVIIISGSRSFNDFYLLEKKCMEIIDDLYIKKRITEEDLNYGGIQIVSGNAHGADSLGERFAKRHNLDLKIMKADWDKYGRGAGYRRNEEMAKYAKENEGILVSFWDGKSPGTKHMINVANKLNLEKIVVRF